MRTTRAPSCAMLAACAGLITSVGLAQSLPDAGSSLRELERRPVLPPVPAGGALIVAPATTATSTVPAGPPFAVRAVRLTGNTVFSDAQLQGLVRDAIGEQRVLGNLQEAADNITRFYRERGYLVARAYVPAQALSDGIVEIRVLEGRIDQVVLSNDSAIRNEVVRRYLAPERLGEIVQVERIDRAVLLLQDVTADPSIGATLRPGRDTGSTEVGLVVHTGPILSGSLEADNQGGRATGRHRAGASVAALSALGLGERADIRLLSSGRGQDYARLALGVPLGGDGLRAGLAYVDSTYRLGSEFTALEASGRARVVTGNLSYPLLRSREANLNLGVNLDAKRLNDRVGATGSEHYKRNLIVAVSLSGDLLPPSGNASTGSVQLDAGRLAIGSDAARMADAATARTEGAYQKLVYSFAHYHALHPRLVLFTAVSGQQASKNLDSSEKFVLGGPFAVRAYPVGEVAADSGAIVTIELRAALESAWLPGQWTVISFVDSGTARVNINPFSASENRQRLSGAGFGAVVNAAPGFELRMSYAFKLGTAPARSDTDRSGRAWLQLSKRF